MFHRYFYDRVKSVKGDRAGENFVAVTDPDTQLGKDAERDNFRKIFINQPDIGGRYSALSYFGMVPAAIAGVDVATLLDRAVHAAHVARRPGREKESGGDARRGHRRDGAARPRQADAHHARRRSTRSASGSSSSSPSRPARKARASFPSPASRCSMPRDYGNDRLFVCVRMRKLGHDVDAARRSPTPAIRSSIIVLEDPLDLGEIFFTWEFATAVAGALLGIDAFDQPNVQESKDNTKRLLEEFKSQRHDARRPARRSTPDDAAADRRAAGEGEAGRLRRAHRVLRRIAGARQAHRRDPRDASRASCTSPRPPATARASSTRPASCTKAGAANGVFLQLTGGGQADVPIPNEKFTFGVLVRAQAIGDFQSLAQPQPPRDQHRPRRATSTRTRTRSRKP